MGDRDVVLQLKLSRRLVAAAARDGFLVLDDNGHVNGWVMVTND